MNNKPRYLRYFAILLLLSAGAGWGEGKKPEKKPAKSQAHPVRDFKEGTNEALNGIDRGVHKALPAVKEGAENALDAVDEGVHNAIGSKKK